MGFFSDGLKKFYQHFTQKYPKHFEKYSSDHHELPIHNESTIDSMAESMDKAMSLFSNDHKNTLVLFVVQENERNEFDQRAIENALYDKQYRMYLHI